MSSGYNIFPLNPTFSGEDAILWLAGIGLELPPNWEQSRVPTPEDFRSALREWEDCEYGESIKGDDLTIWATERGNKERDSSTIIFISNYTDGHADIDMASWLRFNNGRPDWLVAVTERLAQRCGPFLLTDVGGGATIVTSGTARNAAWVDLP